MRMQRLELNFAPAARFIPGVGVALLVVGGLALAAGGAWCGHAWWLRSENADRLVQVQVEAEGLNTQAKRPHPLDAKQQARQRTTQRVAQGLLAPWANLLGALDAASNGSVALLVAAPVSANRSVRLTAEARDIRGMLSYLARLQADGRLSQVVLISHQMLADVPGTPVRFQVQAFWGAAP